MCLFRVSKQMRPEADNQGLNVDLVPPSHLPLSLGGCGQEQAYCR